MKKLSLAGILAVSTAILTLALLPAESKAVTYPTGTLLKCSRSGRVDYVASNGKKYTFPTSNVYYSWPYSINSPRTVSCADFDSVPTDNAMVTLRPGSAVKFRGRNEIYAVATSATLRHVPTPAMVNQIFGIQPRIVELPIARFTDYRVGTPIASASEFAPFQVRTNSGSVNDELIRRGVFGSDTPDPLPPAKLAALSLSHGTLSPAFNSDVARYQASVGNEITQISLTAAATRAGVTMTLTDATTANRAVISGQAIFSNLNVGLNNLRLTVVSENGQRLNYEIVVTRGAFEPPISSDATLGFISIASPDTTYGEAFPQPAQLITRTVANAVTRLRVTALPRGLNTNVTINGQFVPNTPNNDSVTLPLNVGANTITIVVTAEDRVTRLTYTLNITRQAAPVVLSTDATLFSLLENAASNLQPIFSADQLNYTQTVVNGTAQIMITPVSRHTNATVTVNGQSVARGASGNVALQVGANTIRVVVTAEDRVTTRTYTITVTRETAPTTGNTTVETVITQQVFNQLFPNISNPGCNGSAIFTYNNFIQAARSFPLFGAEGTDEIRKREIAAFLAQTSQETTGAPVGGPYSWGWCFKEELACAGGNQCAANYCDRGSQYQCVSNKSYHGRGPMQLSWNYNYGQAGAALGLNLLQNPELVATDGAVSFKTGLWFWMTAQSPKPSAHDVMVGNWQPSQTDRNLGRLPGFGMTTNIINGGIECNKPTHDKIRGRVGYFTRYASMIGTTTGDNLYCNEMRSY